MNEVTVAEFIEWLKTQDQGAIVQCIDHDTDAGGLSSYYCQGGTAQTEDFNSELFEYTDFRGNEHVKPDAPWYNKRYLLIGRSE